MESGWRFFRGVEDVISIASPISPPSNNSTTTTTTHSLSPSHSHLQSATTATTKSGVLVNRNVMEVLRYTYVTHRLLSGGVTNNSAYTAWNNTLYTTNTQSVAVTMLHYTLCLNSVVLVAKNLVTDNADAANAVINNVTGSLDDMDDFCPVGVCGNTALLIGAQSSFSTFAYGPSARQVNVVSNQVLLDGIYSAYATFVANSTVAFATVIGNNVTATTSFATVLAIESVQTVNAQYGYFTLANNVVNATGRTSTSYPSTIPGSAPCALPNGNYTVVCQNIFALRTDSFSAVLARSVSVFRDVVLKNNTIVASGVQNATAFVGQSIQTGSQGIGLAALTIEGNLIAMENMGDFTDTQDTCSTRCGAGIRAAQQAYIKNGTAPVLSMITTNATMAASICFLCNANYGALSVQNNGVTLQKAQRYHCNHCLGRVDLSLSTSLASIHSGFTGRPQNTLAPSLVDAVIYTGSSLGASTTIKNNYITLDELDVSTCDATDFSGVCPSFHHSTYTANLVRAVVMGFGSYDSNINVQSNTIRANVTANNSFLLGSTAMVAVQVSAKPTTAIMTVQSNTMTLQGGSPQAFVCGGISDVSQASYAISITGNTATAYGNETSIAVCLGCSVSYQSLTLTSNTLTAGKGEYGNGAICANCSANQNAIKFGVQDNVLAFTNVDTFRGIIAYLVSAYGTDVVIRDNAIGASSGTSPTFSLSQPCPTTDFYICHNTIRASYVTSVANTTICGGCSVSSSSSSASLSATYNQVNVNSVPSSYTVFYDGTLSGSRTVAMYSNVQGNTVTIQNVVNTSIVPFQVSSSMATALVANNIFDLNNAGSFVRGYLVGGPASPSGSGSDTTCIKNNVITTSDSAGILSGASALSGCNTSIVSNTIRVYNGTGLGGWSLMGSRGARGTIILDSNTINPSFDINSVITDADPDTGLPAYTSGAATFIVKNNDFSGKNVSVGVGGGSNALIMSGGTVNYVELSGFTSNSNYATQVVLASVTLQGLVVSGGLGSAVVNITGGVIHSSNAVSFDGATVLSLKLNLKSITVSASRGFQTLTTTPIYLLSIVNSSISSSTFTTTALTQDLHSGALMYIQNGSLSDSTVSFTSPTISNGGISIFNEANTTNSSINVLDATFTGTNDLLFVEPSSMTTTTSTIVNITGSHFTAAAPNTYYADNFGDSNSSISLNTLDGFTIYYDSCELVDYVSFHLPTTPIYNLRLACTSFDFSKGHLMSPSAYAPYTRDKTFELFSWSGAQCFTFTKTTSATISETALASPSSSDIRTSLTKQTNTLSATITTSDSQSISRSRQPSPTKFSGTSSLSDSGSDIATISFVPFGTANGDTKFTPNTNDRVYGPFPLPIPMPFPDGRTESEYFPSTTGGIFFKPIAAAASVYNYTTYSSTYGPMIGAATSHMHTTDSSGGYYHRTITGPALDALWSDVLPGGIPIVPTAGLVFTVDNSYLYPSTTSLVLAQTILLWNSTSTLMLFRIKSIAYTSTAVVACGGYLGPSASYKIPNDATTWASSSNTGVNGLYSVLVTHAFSTSRAISNSASLPRSPSAALMTTDTTTDSDSMTVGSLPHNHTLSASSSANKFASSLSRSALLSLSTSASTNVSNSTSASPSNSSMRSPSRQSSPTKFSGTLSLSDSGSPTMLSRRGSTSSASVWSPSQSTTASASPTKLVIAGPVCTNALDCNDRSQNSNILFVNGSCQCALCKGNWYGDECQLCPQQYDEWSDCAACNTVDNYVGTYPNCYSDVCNISTVCDVANTRAVTGTVTTGCVCLCRNAWNGSTCNVCQEGFNSSNACGSCLSGWYGYPTSCSPLCTNAGNCSNHAVTVSGTYASGCVCSCSNNWTTSDCSVCPAGYNAETNCSTCAAGYEGYPHCEKSCTAADCSGHSTSVSGTVTSGCVCSCANSWYGNTCSSCPYGVNVATGCDRCVNGYSGFPNCSPDEVCCNHAPSATPHGRHSTSETASLALSDSASNSSSSFNTNIRSTFRHPTSKQTDTFSTSTSITSDSPSWSRSPSATLTDTSLSLTASISHSSLSLSHTRSSVASANVSVSNSRANAHSPSRQSSSTKSSRTRSPTLSSSPTLSDSPSSWSSSSQTASVSSKTTSSSRTMSALLSKRNLVLQNNASKSLSNSNRRHTPSSMSSSKKLSSVYTALISVSFEHHDVDENWPSATASFTSSLPAKTADLMGYLPPLDEDSTTVSTTMSHSYDSKCMDALRNVVASLAPVGAAALSALNDTVVVLQSAELSALSSLSATTTVTLGALRIDREVLLAARAIALNVTYFPQNVRWSVRNITNNYENGANLAFVADVSLFSSSTFALISAPLGGWISKDIPLLSATTVNLFLDMQCGETSILALSISIPAPGVDRLYAEKIEATTRYSQLLSSLGRGASSTSLGRVLATRSLVLCNSDEAVGGGLIDLQLDICSADPSPGSGEFIARSAIVSNIVVLGVVHTAFLALVVIWSLLTRTTLGDAALRFCLPSSLLPVWTAFVPSTAAAAALLFSQLESNYGLCTATDIALAAVGSVISLVPLLSCGVMWVLWTTNENVIALNCVRRGAHHGVQQRLLHHLLRIVDRRWEWTVSCGAATPRPEDLLKPLWAVLLEYRVLWYVTFDLANLTMIAVIGLASGLGGSTLCRGFTAATLGLLAFQLVVLCYTQPFTSIFSFLHGVATLTLTCMSVAFQLAYIELSSNTSTLFLWLVDASAVCNIAVVGISALKLLLDILQVFAAGFRRFQTLSEALCGDSAGAPAVPLQLLSIVAMDDQKSDDDDVEDVATILFYDDDDAPDADNNMLSPVNSLANLRSVGSRGMSMRKLKGLDDRLEDLEDQYQKKNLDMFAAANKQFVGGLAYSTPKQLTDGDEEIVNM